MSLLKRTLPKFFLIFVFIGIFIFGFWFGRNSIICPVCPPHNVDFSLFWQAWNKVHEKYVNPNELDNQKLIYGAIKGMVNSIGDPYTVFFDPKESKTFLEDVSGSFEGVGIEIGLKDGKIQVISPLENTPAKKAGILAGDFIVGIDGKSAIGISLEEAVKLIRGPKNTYVILSIMREGWESPRDFKIKRAKIDIPSLKWYLISSQTGKKDENGDIVYLQLYHFSEKARFDFQKTALSILDTSAKKIILDLRNNPGGYLEVAQYIAGWFLPQGKTVVIEDFGGRREREVYRAEGNGRFSNYPVVVLINNGTASAAEILASALRDNRGVKLVGEKSFGKGCVQELENLRGGSSLKVTVANWLTPNGDLINEKGLAPDIEVKAKSPEESSDVEKDIQLEKAIEVIKGM